MAETYFTENKLDDLIGSLIGITQINFNKIYEDNKARMTEIQGTALRYAYKALNASKNEICGLFEEWRSVHSGLVNDASTASEMHFITYADSCFEASISHLAVA